MTTLAPTISSRYFPHTTGWLRDLFLVVGGTLFVAALAQIRILLPFTPVPITGQTLGVLLVGAALGSKRGASALSLYLVAGAIGLPFFQGGTNGIGIVFGATGGYLIGFIAAAFIIGFLAEHGMDRSIRTSILPFLVGTAVIYLCGAGWLTILFLDFQKAIFLGVFPFLIGDAIKITLAGLILPAAWKLLK